jgi:hypothetical protein
MVVTGTVEEGALTVIVGASTSFWIVVVVGAGFASSLPLQEVRSNATGMARAAMIRFTEESNQTDRS